MLDITGRLIVRDKVRKSTIPEEWQGGMNEKDIEDDARGPSEAFGRTFTDYLRQLPLDQQRFGRTGMGRMTLGQDAAK